MNDEPDFLEYARRIVRAGPICDHCLGRAFGRLGSGLTNAERGRALRVVLTMEGEAGVDGRCWVCDGLFERVDDWAERALALAAGVQFRTYLFGVRLSPRLREMERLFLERFSTGAEEPLKHAFNREVGKRFEEGLSGVTVDFSNPHLSFLIDLEKETIALRIASLYIYGRYRKLIRGIPQTKWPCRKCRGKGCEGCNFTGKQYPESVEELIAPPLVNAAQASSFSLHGAGREDIDARMLGEGRPFVMELISPRVRSLDLEELRDAVNRAAAGKVEVSALSFVARSLVAKVKETRALKRYRAMIEFAEPVSEEDFLSALRSLLGEIEQRTPRRVAHRRSDLVRRRTLHAAEGRLIDPTHAEAEFLTDGGLYVKELVSGDENRTDPSLAGGLGVQARVTSLDVLAVISPDFPDASWGDLNTTSRLT